jgi:hypothetical protein
MTIGSIPSGSRSWRALAGGAAIAGGRRSWFVDVESGRATAYRAGRGGIFNGAGFTREAALSVRFDPRRHRGSDTVWMQQLAKGCGRRRATSANHR